MSVSLIRTDAAAQAEFEQMIAAHRARAAARHARFFAAGQPTPVFPHSSAVSAVSPTRLESPVVGESFPFLQRSYLHEHRKPPTAT